MGVYQHIWFPFCKSLNFEVIRFCKEPGLACALTLNCLIKVVSSHLFSSLREFLSLFGMALDSSYLLILL